MVLPTVIVKEMLPKMSAQFQGGSGNRARLGQELGAAALDKSTLPDPLPCTQEQPLGRAASASSAAGQGSAKSQNNCALRLRRREEGRICPNLCPRVLCMMALPLLPDGTEHRLSWLGSSVQQGRKAANPVWDPFCHVPSPTPCILPCCIGAIT